MSDGLNRVMLLGNLGADPELRFTQAGQAVLNLRLATNESWHDKEKNERKERTEWHTVVVWGKRGEALAKILHKGSAIFVEGSIRTSSYDKDGEKRYKVEIVAQDVLLAGANPNGSSASADRPTGGGGYAARASGAAPRNAAAKPIDPEVSYSAEDADIPF